MGYFGIMLSEQIYFMYGFGICFVFFLIIILLVCSSYRREIAFQCEMRRLEVDAIRDHLIHDGKKHVHKKQ